MEKFAELMLHFYWFRNSLRRADIFLHDPSLRKLKALFLSIQKVEKWKTLQRNFETKTVKWDDVFYLFCIS